MNPWFQQAVLRILTSAAFCLSLLYPLTAGGAEPSPRTDAATVATGVDRLLGEHWRRENVTPAAQADEATLFRRVMLDLAGRIPTAREVEAFLADKSPDRYSRTVDRLIEGPEFAWYFGTVLDEMIQGQLAGNDGFITYLRKSLQDRKRWDAVFREVMVGPWDTPERKPAIGFLDRRAKDLDQLTADVTRSFFGVDITCARCHNHPLVKDWKREHYYGIAAFLVRTTGGKGSIAEKADGEAKFATRDGKERIAKMMFLSGQVVDEPAKPMTPPPAKTAKFSRREELVRLALEEKTFLSRAFVNRMWEYFFGRGLVDPVDQIHSGNPASVPALLDWLAVDFAQSGYDVQRLVGGLVRSKAYRLDNRWAGRDSVPDPGHFAVARLRPLSQRQLATSVLIALGDGRFEPTADRLQAIEKQGAELVTKLDPRARDFQSSTREALFLSNSDAVKTLVVANGDSLTERLAKIPDNRDLVKTLFATTLGRAPTQTESDRIVRWMDRADGNRRASCEDVVWVLIASAEFRFNH
jgi:hypothetical protein